VHWDLEGLQLKHTRFGPRSGLRLDYVGGPQARRIRAVTGELLTRALGCQQGLRPAVLDATFGLGHDSTVIANVGCAVLACESQPVVAALAADALYRARDLPWSDRLTLQYRDAIEVLATAQSGVIYLDPMFVESRRAAPSIEMQFLHALMPDAPTGDALLECALASGAARVVVKRSPKAPPLAARAPATTLQGKAVRFDVYSLRKLSAHDTEAWWHQGAA